MPGLVLALLLGCAGVVTIAPTPTPSGAAGAAVVAGAAPVIDSISVDGTATGIGVQATPHFDWIVSDADRNERVADYSLTVRSATSTWTGTNGGRVVSPTGVTYDGPALESSKRYDYVLRVRDAGGLWSADRSGSFVTGVLREADWTAQWIQRESAPGAFHGRFRTGFTVPPKTVALATLSMSARGLVEARLNGRDVDGSDAIAGDEMLVPKRTATSVRALVRTFDVTALVTSGANALGLEVVNGWYRSEFGGGSLGGETTENTTPAQVIAQLTIRFSDGSTTVVATNDSWRTTSGPILREVPLLGELRDERVSAAQQGWSQPGFATEWAKAVVASPQPTVARVPDARPPIAVVATSVADADQVTPVVVGNGCDSPAAWPTCPTAPVGCRAVNRAGLAAGDTVIVVDVGRIVSGFVSLRDVQPASGRTVEIAYGQTLDSRGRVDERLSLRHWGRDRTKNPCVVAETTSELSALWPDAYDHQVDAFIGDGTRRTLATEFSYKSFRYVEIRGLPGLRADQISIHEVRDAIDTEPDGKPHVSFWSANATLNSVWDAARATLGNQSHGLLEDNVVRERQGWTADAHLNTEAVLETADAGEYWQKWVDDAVADIALPRGLLAYAHPGNPFGGNLDPVWSAALPLVAWRTYLHTGNVDVLRAAWANGEGIAKLVDSYDAIAKDGTPDGPGATLPDGTVRTDDPLLMDVVPWTYGDHGSNSQSNSTTVMNTAVYVSVLRTSAAIAATLDLTKVAAAWNTRADLVSARFEAVFWSAASGEYRGVTPDQAYGATTVLPRVVAAQTTQVVGVAAGTNGLTTGLDLVPNASACQVATCPAAAAIARSASDGQLQSGIIGTQSLFRALVLYGMADLGQQLMLDPRNFAGMAAASGTIGEFWPDFLGGAGVSRDQPGLAAGAVEWVVSGLAGIRPSASGPGFRQFDLRPLLPTGLDAIDLTLRTVRGPIRSAWARTPVGATFAVTVPVGATARMVVPRSSTPGTGAVTVDGLRVVVGSGVVGTPPAGVTVVSATDGSAVLMLGSGTYQIATSIVTPVVNVARNRPTTASSVTGIAQWAAANAVDGVYTATAASIGWHARLGFGAADSPQWLTVDLGATRNVSLVAIWPAQPTGYAAGWYFPRQYAIDVSDSPSFPPGSTRTVVTSGVVTDRPSLPFMHSLAGVSGRYVRFRTLEMRSEGSGYSAAIGEFEVFSPG